MAAPRGNQFWKLRSKHGRDKLFATPDLLWEAAYEYFSWCDAHPWLKKEQLKRPTTTKDKNGNQKLHSMVDIPTARPYTLSGLCLYLGASESFWREFRKNQTLTQDFLSVIHAVEEIISTQQLEGAIVGAFNANIIARKQGLTDKQELDHKGIPAPAKTIQVEIVPPNDDE
jgi:meiotically up-regulated gene 157 (Mug157) protein